MKIWYHLKRPPWRTLVLLVVVLGVMAITYLIWSPGERVQDGRHDLRTNGIWLQHGWLGHDEWFDEHGRDQTLFRDSARIEALYDQLTQHGIKYVFPHLCPCDFNGAIAEVDPVQTEFFLDHFSDKQVIPWVGGVKNEHCISESKEWRASFVLSCAELLKRHPRLAGVQVNIEPMPTGDAHFLELLDELREGMPSGKIISVAAYPPPTLFHRFPEVHWDEEYFREVAKRVDQVVPMMYDTAITFPKFYQNLMKDWTSEVLEWSGDTQVLLGVPAYDDAGVGYHSPEVENISNALLGIHASLSNEDQLPKNYAGVCLYSDWEMDESEWSEFEKEFGKETVQGGAGR